MFKRRLGATGSSISSELAGRCVGLALVVSLLGCVVEPAGKLSQEPGIERETSPGDSRSSIEPDATTFVPQRDSLAGKPNAMPEVDVRVTRVQAAASLYHLPPSLGLGRTASEEEIAAWDIDVMPDGTGLPPGTGSVKDGEILYVQQCESCHGIKADGGRYEALAGRAPRQGFPFSEDPSLRYTVGNYWPYSTTLFDYIRRAMPQAIPGSLTANQTYSLVAYLLYLNELLPEDASLDAQSLTSIVMPARDRFVVDDRRGGKELR